MSAFHHNLPHGAGLIMLSETYFKLFEVPCATRYTKMANAMGGTDFIAELITLQEKCNMRDLKMSDFGIQEDELEAIASNAFDTMGFLCEFDPVPLTIEKAVDVLRTAYR